MMHIPHEVKIAGFNYTVERPNEAFVNGSTAVDGTHSLYDQLIKVAREGTDVYQEMVFLHELMHGIIANYCPNVLSNSDEENLVEQLSKGLYQVIVDNPQILKGVE